VNTVETNSQEAFITMKELCKHLSVSQAYIYQNQSDLKIPRYRIGRAYKYRLSEIDQWVLSQQEI
jgi:excisionase family DNA binding protein